MSNSIQTLIENTRRWAAETERDRPGYFTKLANGGEVPEALNARYANPANQARLTAAKALAERHGVSINEIVMSYLTSQPNQTVPIFGGNSPEQIEDSVKAAALVLSADELAQLRG